MIDQLNSIHKWNNQSYILMKTFKLFWQSVYDTLRILEENILIKLSVS